MSGRCKDCKHFEYQPRDEGLERYTGTCEITRLGDDGYSPEVPTTLAFAADAERYSAVLIVAPDFGCVQFEPAEPRG